MPSQVAPVQITHMVLWTIRQHRDTQELVNASLGLFQFLMHPLESFGSSDHVGLSLLPHCKMISTLQPTYNSHCESLVHPGSGLALRECIYHASYWKQV